MENLKKNSGTKRLSLAKKQTNKQTHNDTLKSTEDKQEGKFTKLEDMSKEVNQNASQVVKKVENIKEKFRRE